MSNLEVAPDPAYQALCLIVKREFGVDLKEANALILRHKLKAYQERHQLSTLQECVEFVSRDASRVKELSDFIYSQSTHFNRHPEHFEFVARTALQENRHKTASAADPLLVWSVGCATGQEAYTVAIYLMEHVFVTPESREAFRIVGSDCSLASLDQARQGHYSAEDVGKLRPIAVEKYFDAAGEGVFSIKDELRRRTEFNEFNMIEEEYPYQGDVDYVFLRNALDFHTEKSRTEILSKVRSALKTGGFLVLGDCPPARAYRYETAAPGCYRAV